MENKYKWSVKISSFIASIYLIEGVINKSTKMLTELISQG